MAGVPVHSSVPTAFRWGTSGVSGGGSGGGGGGATYATRTQSTGTAGENLSLGNILRFDDSGGAGAGTLFRSDATSVSLSNVVGIALSTATTGNTLTFATGGEASVLFSSAPAATLNGKIVYLDPGIAPGKGTTTLPTTGTIVRIGYLSGADGATTTPTVVLSVQLIAAR